MTEQVPTFAGKIYDTPSDQFDSIVLRLESAIQNKNDMVTEHASEWKNAKSKGVNNEALKLCLKLKKQDQSKTADFLRAFDAYTDAMGIRSQTDLFEQKQAQAKENEANAESIENASANHDVTEPEFEEAAE